MLTRTRAPDISGAGAIGVRCFVSTTCGKICRSKRKIHEISDDGTDSSMALSTFMPELAAFPIYMEHDIPEENRFVRIAHLSLTSKPQRQRKRQTNTHTTLTAHNFSKSHPAGVAAQR